MKIGVITDWTSDNNYGEILQCWALQQILKREGHQPFLIRFLRYDWSNDSDNSGKSFIQTLKRYLIILIKIIFIKPAIDSFLNNKEKRKIEGKHPDADVYYAERNKERKFASFFDTNIETSQAIYHDYEELCSSPPAADIYITGSDQVWNYNMHISETKAFFLQFGDEKIKRISYAPSVGHDSWPEKRKEELRQYLSAFDAISVREDSGVDICKSVGFNATHVLDPTLLLTSDSYTQLIKDAKYKEEPPYIYIYSMNYSYPDDIAWNEIREYARENRLRIKVTPGAGYTPCREIFDDVEYDYATIPGWITNIAHAHLVITASFHGSVFAILFHKQLMYTPLKGEMSKSNSRVLGMLENFDLNCMIYNKKRKVSEYAVQVVEWEKVDENKNACRVRSISYLRQAIG